MSSASLRAEIELVLADQEWKAAAAAIADFLRALHETMTKCGRDQNHVFSQVQAVFGSIAMHHLAKTLQARPMNLQRYQLADDCPLYPKIVRICQARGFTIKDGRALFSHFLKALDEERTSPSGDIESATVMIYWAISDEAAYHLGGLYVGDDLDVVATQLMGYLDRRLERFHKLVEMWEMELAWDKEDGQ